MKQKITSHDVAKAAGVSQSMVSLVLNCVPGKNIRQETREKVLAAAKKLNYEVNINARNMKNRRAGAIGILSHWRSNSFVFPPVIDGVQSICMEKGHGVVVCTGKMMTTGNYDYVDYYLQNRIDGLIYVSYVGITKECVIGELEKYGVPFVCVIGARDLPEVSCVDVSFFESGYIAGVHLAEKGYSNVLYPQYGDTDTLVYAEKERLEGCRRAALDLNFQLHSTALLIGGKDEKTMIETIKQVLKDRTYDAVVSTSYTCYLFLKAAVSMGIDVPESFGVISLDNELYAPYLYPSLTTVDEPLFNIAKCATEILYDRINNRSECIKIELSPCLTARESTKRSGGSEQ
jgi:LacI family transcriptional regulator